MTFDKNYIPRLPFSDFKWRWACYQCTEGINDPIVYLGVLSQLYKCRGKKSSSEEFAEGLATLQEGVTSAGLNVRVWSRGGSRNIIRNSGQYWKALGLLAPEDNNGTIILTKLGEALADHRLTQANFAAISVLTLELPNKALEDFAVVKRWEDSGIKIKPLTLILKCLIELHNRYGSSESYLTGEELCRIIIPLSSNPKVQISDYVNFLRWYRDGELHKLNEWPRPNEERSNDKRMACEFLLFLMYYGYVIKEVEAGRLNSKYFLNEAIIDEIISIVSYDKGKENHFIALTTELKLRAVSEEIVSKRIRVANSRPNQASFRRMLLDTPDPRCAITEVSMEAVLEAAHIKPYSYNGPDTISNGLLLRSDIHTLFDGGHLRISPEGKVELSQQAKMSYGESVIRSRIVIPDYVDRDYLAWRWENYNSI